MTFQHGAKQTLGMLDIIVTEIWNRPTTSFLDFTRMKNAQAAHEHTKHPSTQLGSVSFVDAIGHFRITFGLLFKLITITDNKRPHFQRLAFKRFHNKNTMAHAGTKSSPLTYRVYLCEFTVAMLVSPTNLPGIELYSYANDLF